MTKPYKVKVEWKKAMDIGRALIYGYDYEDYLYMILRGNPCVKDSKLKLMYIGQAYHSFISDRLNRHHKLWIIIDETPSTQLVYVKFGKIIVGPGKKRTKTLVNDIENSLIFEHQPKYNAISRSNCYTSKELVITNTKHYSPLEKKVEVYWD